MQKLSKDATRIFMAILDKIPSGETHVRINIDEGKEETEPTFMPLSVEYLYTVNVADSKAKVYSFMHFYVQEGDVMRDPDVEFAVVDNRTPEYPVVEMIAVYPIVFQQSSTATYHQAAEIENGKIASYKPKMQQSIVTFCNQWMNNIKMQQQIKPLAIPDVLQFMLNKKKQEQTQNSQA